MSLRVLTITAAATAGVACFGFGLACGYWLFGQPPSDMALAAAPVAKIEAPRNTPKPSALTPLTRTPRPMPAAAVPIPAILPRAESTVPAQKPSKEDVLPRPAAISKQVTTLAIQAPRKAPIRPAPKLLAPGPHPALVAIVIDDLGNNLAAGRRAVALPGPLTLSFMPYTRYSIQLSKSAKKNGHELFVHLPMEPEADTSYPGPNALLTTVSDAELRRRLDWNLSRFDGYVGINNHMGSYFTASRPHMTLLMGELKRRGLLFLDSKTTPNSVGMVLASNHGVAHTGRDIFLDHRRDRASIRAQFFAAARRARERGSVVAIGHPYPQTLAVLAKLLPELTSRGYRLVPVSEIVRHRRDGGS